jgi:biopolymer transport protein ExbD
MNLRSRNKVNVSFSMSSMTDVVFLLLIFFMITATLITPSSLDADLPDSKGQVMAERPIISISITNEGNNTYAYAVGTNKVAFNNIEAELQIALKEADEQNPTIKLHADKSVPMSEIKNIMLIAKENKYRLILATKPK